MQRVIAISRVDTLLVRHACMSGIQTENFWLWGYLTFIYEGRRGDSERVSYRKYRSHKYTKW